LYPYTANNNGKGEGEGTRKLTELEKLKREGVKRLFFVKIPT
jgi:hypothetical protein